MVDMATTNPLTDITVDMVTVTEDMVTADMDTGRWGTTHTTHTHTHTHTTLGGAVRRGLVRRRQRDRPRHSSDIFTTLMVGFAEWKDCV